MPYGMKDSLVKDIVAAVTPEHMERARLLGSPEDVAKQVESYRTQVPAAPTSVIVKSRGRDEARMQLGALLGLFDREAYFYREVAPRIPVRTPRAFANGDGHSAPHVLDDLGDLRTGDQSQDLPEDPEGWFSMLSRLGDRPLTLIQNDCRSDNLFDRRRRTRVRRLATDGGRPRQPGPRQSARGWPRATRFDRGHAQAAVALPQPTPIDLEDRRITRLKNCPTMRHASASLRSETAPSKSSMITSDLLRPIHIHRRIRAFRRSEGLRRVKLSGLLPPRLSVSTLQ